MKKDFSKRALESIGSSKPNKKSRNVESFPKLSLNERLLKVIKKKEEWKLPITPKELPPRVQLEVGDLEMKERKKKKTKKQIVLKCAEGHEINLFRIGKELDATGHLTDYVCDRCEKIHMAGGEEVIWQCKFCKLDLCQTCAHKEAKKKLSK